MTQQRREFAATTVLRWLRDETAAQEMGDVTPRGVRDTILRMLPLEGGDARRVANELTRWIGDEEGYVRVRWQEDIAALRAILRVIDRSLDNAKGVGAEADEDLPDDLTASTYPKLFEWIRHVQSDMAVYLRDQRRLGVRPKRAFQGLLAHARDSLEAAVG